MILMRNSIFIGLFFFSFLYSAKSQKSKDLQSKNKSCCTKKIPNRFKSTADSLNISIYNNSIDLNSDKENMSFIQGGVFMMGGDNDPAREDEFPKHKVQLNSFYIDKTEVTNSSFRKFVDATGYVTTAEKDVDWNEMKKQLPPNTPMPDSELLKAASLVFVPTETQVNLSDYSQWWQWKKGANWKHPQGPESDIIGKDNFPVVQISWDDANAYCKWAGKRLPTEAEWEYAARGGKINTVYSWGNEFIDSGNFKCNYWQGSFPNQNDTLDGFYNSSPVKSFLPNKYGLYDMSGNVWEWCSDLYNYNYYKSFPKKSIALNPKGPSKSFDPDEPLIKKRVMRGGSFLCNESYCSGYRNSSRMKSSQDTGMEHVGFRCVKDK
jgi:formylglycine-generating enzyme required for sulfatase activity